MTKKGFELGNWENSFYIFIVKFYYEKEGEGGKGKSKRKKEREYFKNKPNEVGCSDCKKGGTGNTKRERKKAPPG